MGRRLMQVSGLYNDIMMRFNSKCLDRPSVKQAGTGPSRRHIQGSKKAKGLPRVNLQYSKIEKQKWTKWRSGAR